MGTHRTSELSKIDAEAVNGLLGTQESLGYIVAKLSSHNHSPEQIYGLTTNTMARKAVTPIVITGGSGAWGTELEIHNGSVIESGSATKYFDLNKIAVTAVGTANRVTALEFYANTASDSVACTFQNTGDTITKAGHSLADGTRIMFTAGGGALPAELNIYTVYYVISSTAATTNTTFQVSLTLGGSAVTLGSDGSMSYFTVTQSLMTEAIVSRAATATDSLYIPMNCARTLCNKRISCRGWAAGGTNAISFFIGLHTYEG